MRLSRRVAVVAALGIMLASAAASFLATPRDHGLTDEWSAQALEGEVVAGRALVGAGNAALDLRTGKSVTLGSVSGGTRYLADDRLIIAGDGRVDSVRLDASARWTWRAPAGSTATPVAAASGSTLVAACPATGPCELVGLNAKGLPDWQRTSAERVKPPAAGGGLPQVFGNLVEGGGLFVTEPASGRQALIPGSSFLAIPDGPVVAVTEQGGQCVVSAHVAADAAWTRVLGACPDGRLPALSAPDATLQLTWPSRTERLDLATGGTVRPPPTTSSADEVATSGQVATSGPLVLARSLRTLHTNPFRWGQRVTILKIRDTTAGDVLAQLVSAGRLEPLHLNADAIVVREESRIVRYTLDDPR